MPKTNLPVPVEPFELAAFVLTEDLQAGYSFTQDRWEGDDGYDFAQVVALYWQSQGWRSSVHEGEFDSWSGGKKQIIPYYKVWIGHPEDKDLYAWWAPAKEEWAGPIRTNELTWFEFVKAKK